MNERILKEANQWIENKYFDESDRVEIKNLLHHLPATETELMERFFRDLEFGTGGLRAPMGAGRNRMNKYNVRKATQALCLTIKKYFSTASTVISYDSRHSSKDFAMEAATVFAANGIKAYLFEDLTPTPMLSYAVRKLKAKAGIMITASHNPPIYNGYKAFWEDGAQVITPIDKEIISHYNELSNWEDVKFINFHEGMKKELICYVPKEINEHFYQIIENKVIQNLEMCKRSGEKLKIVYTALHGTGQIPCSEISRRLGFLNFHSISSQSIPDGNFSTVKSPNPEDPSALKLAVDFMQENNYDIVFGTDPDCDRLGVAINNHGTPAYLNGNQIAVLMLHYLLTSKSMTGKLPADFLVIKSIVTSSMQDALVKKFGGTLEETLTGFKWMAAKIKEYELNKSNKEFLFASEESFGYMPHSECRDKDGVSSVALFSEIALFYKLQDLNLVEALDKIYEEFGFYAESLVALDYEGIAGSEKISRIMNYFRNYTEGKFSSEEILSIVDYEKGEFLPKSNVLCLNFKSGAKLFLRPSGTEPKIKFYTLVCEEEGNLATKKRNAQNKIVGIENDIRKVCERI
jgi:phosphoglucomutase